MYLLDWKIPKHLEPLSELLSKEFRVWLVERDKKKITPRSQESANNAVSCFVKNTCFALSCGKSMVYIPRKESIYAGELIYNGTKINRKVSYTYTLLLCDFLFEKYNCFMTYGGVFWEFDLDTYKKTKGKVKTVRVGNKFTTGVKMSDKLIEVFTPYLSKSLELPLSVLEIRDQDGNLVSKKLTVKQKEIIKILTSLNIAIIDNNICLKGDKLDFSVKKIYNQSSFNYGGRNYLMGTNSQQAQSAATRLQITINDEPCVELDYSHLHPSIMADLFGVRFPDDYSPYDIQFEGMDKQLLKSIAKKGLLMIINTDSVQSAAAALSNAISEEPLKSEVKLAKQNGMWPDGRVVHTVIEKLVEHNGYLLNITGANTGLELMNIESQMCDIVIEKVLMEGEVLIPLHDGFIIQERNAKMVESFMFDAYDSVVGGYNCRIKMKKAEA